MAKRLQVIVQDPEYSEIQRAAHSRRMSREIIHHYNALNRPHDIQPAFDAVLNVVDEVLPIDLATTERTKQIVLSYRGLSARDAVHLAVMEQHGVAQIFSFDKGFDSFPGITRLF